jgi:hypothetical protein
MDMTKRVAGGVRKVSTRITKKKQQYVRAETLDTAYGHIKKLEMTIESLNAIPRMHDATTTMKKFVADGGVVYEIDNAVIINKDIVSNLHGDVQVLKLRLASGEETQKGFDTMKEDIDAIALFLREEFAREISLGHHANRTLGAIVTGYLGEFLSWR